MKETAKEMVIKIQNLLDEKKTALEIIFNLTLAQKEDIEKNQGDNLQKFIDKKQIEIDKIIKIDESFADTVSSLKKELGIESLDNINVADYPEFKDIKDLTAYIMDLGKKIIELEEQNKIKVQNLIDDIKKEIKTVNTGQRFMKAYERPNIGATGIYIDRKK